MESYTAPGLMVGDEWWQQLVGYGLARKWDSEYLLPFTTNKDAQYFKGTDGRYYKQGEPLPVAPAVNTLWIVAGVIAVAAVAYIALK